MASFGGLPITLRGTNQLCDRPVLLINDFEPLVAPRPLEGCRGITSHNGRNFVGTTSMCIGVRHRDL